MASAPKTSQVWVVVARGKFQSNAHYGLIAAGISVAIIAVVQGLGTKLTSTFTTVKDALN